MSEINLTHAIKLDDGNSEPIDIFIQGDNIKEENGESISGNIKFIYFAKSIELKNCNLIYDTENG